jgi:hypothetical protein
MTVTSISSVSIGVEKGEFERGETTAICGGRFCGERRIADIIDVE